MRRLSVLLACALMAMTLLAIAVGTGASAAPKHFYGALDYSKAKSAVYWGTGTSKAAANQASYNNCHTKHGANDCLTVVWVYNGWVAVAQSNKFFDVGWGRTKQAASNTAVKRCQAGGAPPCTVSRTFRTAFDPNKKTTGGYKLPGP